MPATNQAWRDGQHAQTTDRHTREAKLEETRVEATLQRGLQYAKWRLASLWSQYPSVSQLGITNAPWGSRHQAFFWTLDGQRMGRLITCDSIRVCQVAEALLAEMSKLRELDKPMAWPEQYTRVQENDLSRRRA